MRLSPEGFSDLFSIAAASSSCLVVPADDHAVRVNKDLCGQGMNTEFIADVLTFFSFLRIFSKSRPPGHCADAGAVFSHCFFPGGGISSSEATPMTSAFVFERSYSSFYMGHALRQGTHQLAQSRSVTYFPFRLDKVRELPLSSLM